jgi:putative flippase GtrA
MSGRLSRLMPWGQRRRGHGRPHGLRTTLLRYGAGSVVATVCSEITFVVLYGVFGATTTVSSVLGWLAGAVPNYWLNRSWTWGRRGRPSLTGEVLPYALVVLVTLGLAITATAAADAALSGAHGWVRTVLVGGTFLLVYVVMFLLRFVLFDRLFAGDHPARPHDQPDARPLSEEPAKGGP